jgi:hypothetical protein
MPRNELIQTRRGTAAAWASANPVLAAGEPGFVTDTADFKIGDGVTAWNSLKTAGNGTYLAAIMPEAYGAKADGTTDDTAAIRAALTAAGAIASASSGIATVRLSGGKSYNYAGGGSGLGLDIPSGVILDGGGARLVRSDWTINGAFVRIRGTLASSAKTTLSSNASTGALVLPVASTTGIAAGDYFLLGSTTPFNSATLGTPANNNKGEVVHVKSVDSGTQLTVWEPLRDTYLTSATASLYAITHTVGGGIRDLRITDSQPDTHKMGFVEVQHARGITVDGFHARYSGGAALVLDNVVDSTVTDSSFSEQKDDTSNGWFGYGINISNSCEGITVDSCHFERVRHGVTTTGGGGGRMGVARNVVVSNCTARACTAPAFDTHPDGDAVTFVGNTINGCGHAGIQLRSPNSHAIGNVITYCGTGIQLTDGAQGCQVKDNVIRHIADTGIGGQGNGIRVAGLGSPDHNLIANNTIAATAYAGIHFTLPDSGGAGADPQRTRIVGNQIFNSGQSAAFKAGVYVDDTLVITGLVVEGNFFQASTAGTEQDYSATMDYAIRVPTTCTGGYFANNVALGLNTGMINDAAGTSTTNLDHNNVRLDNTTATTLSRGLLVKSGADANIGLAVRQNTTSQSGNLQEWQKADGSFYGRVDSQGTLQFPKVASHCFGGAGMTGVTLGANAGADTQVALAARANSGSQAADIMQILPSTGSAKAAFNAGGSFLVDDNTKGIILKDANAHYWRGTLNTSGVLSFADLGTTRPTG